MNSLFDKILNSELGKTVKKFDHIKIYRDEKV